LVPHIFWGLDAPPPGEATSVFNVAKEDLTRSETAFFVVSYAKDFAGNDEWAFLEAKVAAHFGKLVRLYILHPETNDSTYLALPDELSHFIRTRIGITMDEFPIFLRQDLSSLME